MTGFWGIYRKIVMPLSEVFLCIRASFNKIVMKRYENEKKTTFIFVQQLLMISWCLQKSTGEHGRLLIPDCFLTMQSVKSIRDGKTLVARCFPTHSPDGISLHYQEIHPSEFCRFVNIGMKIDRLTEKSGLFICSRNIGIRATEGTCWLLLCVNSSLMDLNRLFYGYY